MSQLYFGYCFYCVDNKGQVVLGLIASDINPAEIWADVVRKDCPVSCHGNVRISLSIIYYIVTDITLSVIT